MGSYQAQHQPGISPASAKRQEDHCDGYGGYTAVK